MSVWNKTGIVDLAKRLHALGAEIISTGGTMGAIASAGVPVSAVSEATGFPEILDGRVKTLHPAIHGGLLARRDDPQQMAELERHAITAIDLVVGNLYPFGEVVAREHATLDDALEHIDIGGPAMIRAAAKNFPGVLVVVDPADYDGLADEISAVGIAGISLERRRALAAKAFAHVATYDAVVASYLDDSGTFPPRLVVAGRKIADLRYGENPHQRAAIYGALEPRRPVGVASWRLLGGKEMSFNNYLDANAARSAVLEFSAPAVVIVKHGNPCGVATGSDLAAAYRSALDADPVSAFGGVVALNGTVDEETAELIAERFFEVVIAPAVSDGARAALARKRNLRVVEAPGLQLSSSPEIRPVDGGFLVQDPDQIAPRSAEWQIVTERAPTAKELEDLEFVWRVVRHVKSNAIVLGRDGTTVGIGGGQPNRVDAVRLAVERAGERAKGAVLASDAFFPFPDGVEAAAEAGVVAVVQPGGSVRDAEVIDRANAGGIAMVFTGVRHFRH